jgi:predicted DNA-binding protein (MmcQ/YjbR family)
MNFKVDPDEADELRERWPSVTPGYHMNKRHWSTLAFDGRVPRSLVFEWVERSHDLVVAGLTKKERAAAGL